MIDINELRASIKTVGVMAVSTQELSELLDRLEAAEKSDAESIAMYRKARDERDALRAKIAEMEQQEPVAYQHKVPCVNLRGDLIGHSGWQDGKRLDQWPTRALYALPGAQPAPSVPDGWKLVPIVSTHEMKEAGVCAGAVYCAIAKDVWSAMLAASPKLEGK